MQPGGPLTLRILLVEDEFDLREAMSEILREAGHHLVEVDTVERARSSLAETHVDVLVLDLVVRDGTSEEFLADIARTTPTVLTSADVARSRALAAKYEVPLLLKPFDLDELIPAVLRAHDERRSRSRL